MTPQFQALTEALGAERAQLTETTSSPDPELVAVFDVAGSVDRFLRACAQIPGLEFLADLQDDNANADEDFFYEAKDGDPSDNGVPTSLYLVMSNAQAVAELVRLFELGQADPQVTFERGLAPLKDVFGLLRSIRRWGVEDRVRETGLLEQWREDVANIGQTGTARVEIELWFRDNETDRQHAENRVVELLVAANASVIRTVVLPQIQFHGLLAEIPYDQVAAVVEHGPDHIALLSANAIMFVSPATTMALPSLQPSKNETISLGSRPAVGKPRVALLDGLPLAQHVAVQNRLVIDDPDDRGSRYGGGQHSHGTAMASLILHGDLADPGEPLSGPLYVRPIMQPHPWAPGRPEIVPEDELLIDLIHRAFLRMFEEEGTQPPASPGVRIVNLSIGDPARMFARRMSPLAKLVDWLSHKYNVLVVVSAGNHDHVLSIPWQAGDSSAALPGKAVRVLHAGARSRRLLSPAEAMNAITVGAQHSDSVAADLPDTVIDLFEQGGPAPYSSIGFGYRRSIKPDALLPGGRQIFQRPVDLEGASGLVELSPVPTLIDRKSTRLNSSHSS